MHCVCTYSSVWQKWRVAKIQFIEINGAGYILTIPVSQGCSTSYSTILYYTILFTFQVQMLFDDDVFFNSCTSLAASFKPSHLQQQTKTWNKPSTDEQAEHLFYFKSWKCTSGPLTRANLSDFPPDTSLFTPWNQTEHNLRHSHFLQHTHALTRTAHHKTLC